MQTSKHSIGIEIRSESGVSQPFDDATLYRQPVGSLFYLSNTVCLDTVFAVVNFSGFIFHPTQITWKAGKHIVRNLRATKQLAVVYDGNDGDVDCAFSEAY